MNDVSEKGYFKLHVNEYGTIETMTCLAPFAIDGWKLYKIWGKHVKLLNNLAERYKAGLISDLYEYFEEPWASAIYHDKFTILENNMRSLMTTTSTGKVRRILFVYFFLTISDDSFRKQWNGV